ncbi:MAG TPA: helix-turn-helix domain-containing protein [Caulobacteraceae bacterium]|jgi:IclR family mhp operon transcriptional activator|nr:helix-turn-helix domain-containing protein [Caulobacteraceae bacterium]
MTAQSVKSIRALERGLDVLQALQTGPGAGLKDLHVITGLPKATLLRILRTLAERNLVWQRMADGAYLPSLRAARPPGDNSSRLVEVASPVMAGLCELVNWPSVLAVRRGAQMEVIETNRPRSHVSHLPLGPVGARISMLLTSTGRAYFSFCTQAEREEILDRLQAEPSPEAMLARDAVWVARVVSQTQAQGYGQRDPSIAGEGVGQKLMADDGRNSIAVPIIVAGQVVASLNLTWTRRATNASHIVGEHLEALRAAAAETALRLAAQPA